MANITEIHSFENKLISKLLTNADISDRLLPYLKSKHFTNNNNRDIVNTVLNHVEKYQKTPSYSELKMVLVEDGSIEHFEKNIQTTSFDDISDEVFVEEAEYFMKAKLFWDAIADGANALQIKDKTKQREEFAKILPRMMEADSFCFDNNVGLDPLEQIEKLLDSLHLNNAIVSTGLKVLDDLIAGGFPTKELTLFLGETSIGKTLTMCALAVSVMKKGKNVLYVTHEMRDAKIGERIVANLIDLETKKIRDPNYKDTVIKRTQAVAKLMRSRLKIKEYPTSTANTNHIMTCVKDLEKKMKWKPDLIFVDSVNIMLPNNMTKGMNSNDLCMAISTDLRRMAFMLNVPVVSCMQLKREGFNSSNVEITDVAGSIGSMTVAGVIIAITQPQEMKDLHRYIFKTLKVRDEERYKTAYVNVDYGKMRLSNCEQGDYSTEQPKIVHNEKDLEEALNMVAPSLEFGGGEVTNNDFSIDFG